jgi:hypothetical protein
MTRAIVAGLPGNRARSLGGGNDESARCDNAALSSLIKPSFPADATGRVAHLMRTSVPA